MLAQEITLPTVNSAPIPTNENYKVDVNRGCVIRIDPTSGAAVYMYWDQPGVFFNDHARQVPPEFAAQAGFDIEPLLKARRKQEAFAKARQEVEAQFNDKSEREVLEQEGEFLLVHLGKGQYTVEYDDGTALIPRPVSKELAEKTYRSLFPPPEEDPIPAKK